MVQDEIFSAYEGDNWFKRNATVLAQDNHIANDWPLKLLDLAQGQIKPKRILEVGCSNGWRLAELKKRFEAECYGVEPSDEGVKNGKSRYPALQLTTGTASQLPFENAMFDLVVVNFVLHWISREKILQSLAEIDRVLVDGGHLIVGDFLPDHRTRRKYHHLPTENVFTFKQDYPSLFTSTGMYSEVCRQTFSHDSNKLGVDTPSWNRAVCSLLQKSLSALYVTESQI